MCLYGEKSRVLFICSLKATNCLYLNPLIPSVIMCSRAVQTLRNHFKKLFFFFPSQEYTHYWLYVIKRLIKSLNIYILALKAIIFRQIFFFKRKKQMLCKLKKQIEQQGEKWMLSPCINLQDFYIWLSTILFKDFVFYLLVRD